MAFIDGWSHGCGAEAFDGAASIKWAGGDGKLSAHLESLYDQFSDKDAVYGERLNSKRVEAMNLKLQGVGPNSYVRDDLYTDWQPRVDEPIQDMMGYTGAVTVLDKKKLFAEVNQKDDKGDLPRLLVQDPLDEFYKAVMEAGCGISSKDQDNPHPRAALGCLLPAAAILYAKLAELHPFIDGNSRTRTMILQTQLVRAGAHPVVLYNNGWAAYHMNSVEELEEYLLGGYCAWEYVAATGKSPYIGHLPAIQCNAPTWENHQDMQRMGANKSPILLYDKKKDVCLRPPTPSREVVRDSNSASPFGTAAANNDGLPWCANPPSCTIRNHHRETGEDQTQADPNQ